MTFTVALPITPVNFGVEVAWKVINRGTYIKLFLL